MADSLCVRSTGDDPVYFLHVEKTGGSSVHRILSSVFPAGQVCTVRLWQELEGVRPETITGFSLYSGHLTGSFPEFLGTKLRTVTLLRDPVQRSISHYAHIRRDPSSPYYRLAQSMSLREFCLHPATRPLIEDYQTRSLAGGTLATKTGWASELPVPATEAERAAMLARARQVLHESVAVGVTERLSDTLAVFAAALGLGWSGPTPYENASYNRPREIDQETLDVIRSITRSDAALHEEAGRMLDAAIARVSALPNIAAAGFESRNSVTRLLSPERSYRLKLWISSTVCRAPRWIRQPLAALYALYRVLVDPRVPLRARLPLILAALYAIGPFDLMQGRRFPLSILDDVGFPALGFAASLLLVGRPLLDEIRLAAFMRFDLGPSSTRRSKPFRRDQLL